MLCFFHSRRVLFVIFAYFTFMFAKLALVRFIFLKSGIPFLFGLVGKF